MFTIEFSFGVQLKLTDLPQFIYYSMGGKLIYLRIYMTQQSVVTYLKIHYPIVIDEGKPGVCMPSEQVCVSVVCYSYCLAMKNHKVNVKLRNKL